jgi:hypothetical protein
MMTLEFHPLANIFPLLEGEAFEELVADIKANGLREKIDLYQGKIVDGRYRYRALQRLGIDPSADPSRYFRKALYVHSVGGEAVLTSRATTTGCGLTSSLRTSIAGILLPSNGAS